MFFFFVLLFSSMILSSCNNIHMTKGTTPSTTILQSSPSSGMGGAFQLTGVYASQQALGSVFDMIGVDSMFDTYCTGANGPCVCEYTYTSPGVGLTVVEEAVTYQESDLLRCNNAVPTGIASFEVRILAKGSNDNSNTISVNLSSTAFVNTNFVDLTSEESFKPVSRFQCRHRESVPNPLSPNMVDPIQSEDPKLIYPFNFYTTNVAQSLWSMQGTGNQEWDCTLTPTYNYGMHWWANPYVFSASTCSGTPFCNGDSELVYPITQLSSDKVPASAGATAPNAKRRASFYLAKQRYGVFDVALTAAIAPNTYTAGTYGSIGFAARTIPQAGGTSACPNIPIPSNATWVKVWNFAATDLKPPSYVDATSQTFANSGIACNPAGDVFPSCFQFAKDKTAGAVSDFNSWMPVQLHATSISAFLQTPVNGAAPQLSSFSDTTTLASRVVFLNNAGSNPANACHNITAMGDGMETWHPSPFGFTGFSADEIKSLPWGLYQGVTQSNKCGGTYNYVSAAGGPCNGLKNNQYEPSDTQLHLSKFTESNYSDNLFVVTDPSVNDTQMRNLASGVSQYRPVTYRTAGDCNCASQTGCPAGCSPSKAINWHVDVKAPGSASTSADMFPLCVLQFKQ